MESTHHFMIRYQNNYTIYLCCLITYLKMAACVVKQTELEQVLPPVIGVEALTEKCPLSYTMQGWLRSKSAWVERSLARA